MTAGDDGNDRQPETGRQESRERVGEAFERAVAIDDPAIFISLADRERALSLLDPSAPLAGMTFAVKDNIDVADTVTTAGCPSFGYRPGQSATVVARLEAAGATCVGKTNLDQFATGLVGTRSPYGTPVNPVDPLLIPGGSSSGSAVAVARGLVDFALGTDTAGSGRVPAAHTRIVGLKPTKGRLSTRGVVPAVRSLDCVSVFARSVAEGWLALTTAEGFDPGDPYSRPGRVGPCPAPVRRVGVPRLVDTDSDLDQAAWQATVTRLAATAGVELVEVDVEPLVEAGGLLYGGPWVAERYAAVGSFLAGDADAGPPADADPTVAAIIGGATAFSAVDAFRAEYRLAELRRQTEPLWDDIDVLAVPTMPGPATVAEVVADPIGRNTRLGLYTNFVNLLDLCGVAVPGVDRADGRPFGLSMIGPAWSDATVADLAGRWCDEPPGAAADGVASTSLDVVVVGAHLAGLPLNHQLTDLGGRFVAATTTAPAYRFLELAPSGVRKPGLIHVGDGGGQIEVEIWRLPIGSVGPFLAMIPPPLGLGTIELADGERRTGFIAEPRAAEGATDITATGGWRTHLGLG